MSQITGADLSAIDAILKEQYRDPIIDLLNHKTVLLHALPRDSESFVGSEAIVPLNTGRNEGIGSRPEAGSTTASDLPSAGKQGYSRARYRPSYHYGAVQFTGTAIASARTDEGAFARVVDSEMKGLVRDMVRDQNRQLYTGKSGVLTQCDGAPGAGSLTDNQIAVDSVQYLRVGMSLDVIDVSDGTTVNETASVITAIDKDNKVITFGADADINSAADNDYLVRTGSLANEMWGLIDLVSDVNPTLTSSADSVVQYVGGINRTTAANSFWKSTVEDWSNGQFKDTIFRSMIDTVDQETDGMISMFITDYQNFNDYGNSLLVDRRFNTEGTRFATMDGSFGDMLEYNGIPVAKDRDCPYNNIFGLDLDSLMLLEASDWDWMDKDGSVLSRVPKKDAYEAILFAYKEFGIENPKANARYINVGAAQ